MHVETVDGILCARREKSLLELIPGQKKHVSALLGMRQ